jgi:hypothetical protein
MGRYSTGGMPTTQNFMMRKSLPNLHESMSPERSKFSINKLGLQTADDGAKRDKSPLYMRKQVRDFFKSKSSITKFKEVCEFNKMTTKFKMETFRPHLRGF